MSYLDISIIIPAKNEGECLPALIDEIYENLAGHRFEVIVVDDGSTDGTADSVIQMNIDGKSGLRLLRHKLSCGQSAALLSGLSAARGNIIVTLDGDGQNNPKYVPELLESLAASDKKTGMVAGQRTGRKNTALKKMASRLANSLRGAMLKDHALDSACGLKAIRKELFLRLPFFDAWHRFLPALVVREGYEVKFVQIVDRPRIGGQSKYGIWDRGVRGILDLLGVWWLMKRGRKDLTITEEISND